MNTESSSVCQGLKSVLYSCTCSYNVGQLANDAVYELAIEGYCIFGSLFSVNAGHEPDSPVADAQSTVVAAIHGCERKCISKLLALLGIPEQKSLVITDLGIEPVEHEPFSEEELILVKDGIVACCTESVPKPPPAPCGCSCL